MSRIYEIQNLIKNSDEELAISLSSFPVTTAVRGVSSTFERCAQLSGK